MTVPESSKHSLRFAPHDGHEVTKDLLIRRRAVVQRGSARRQPLSRWSELSFGGAEVKKAAR
jgi:hypothetical protein